MIPDKATYNFPQPFTRGTTFRAKEFQIMEEVNSVNVPINLTGANILIQFKINEESPKVFEFRSDDNTILITDALNGIIELQSRILNVPAAIYKYDVKITLANGYTKVYLEGSLRILKNISE